MLLPCRHIFYARKLGSVPLYNENLCHARWRRDVYLRSFNIGTHQQTSVHLTNVANKRKLTVQEKRKKVAVVCNNISNIASLSCSNSFDRKLRILQRIEDAWRNGEEVEVLTSSRTNELPDSYNEVVDRVSSPNRDHSSQYDTNFGVSAASSTYDTSVPCISENTDQCEEEPECDSALKKDCSSQNDTNLRILRAGIDYDCISEENVFENTDDCESSQELTVQSSVSETENITGVIDENTNANHQNPVNNAKKCLKFVDAFHSTIRSHNEIVNEGSQSQSTIRSESNIPNIQLQLANIVMPNKIKRRGRPKGADITVLGLKRKRR